MTSAAVTPNAMTTAPACSACGEPATTCCSTLPMCADCSSTPAIRREARRVYQASVKARRAGAADELTLAEWLDMLVEHDWNCAYCRTRPMAVLDHVRGLAAGNVAANVAPACRRCNALKGKEPGFRPPPRRSVRARGDARLRARWATWKSENPTGTLDDFAQALASSYAPMTVFLYTVSLERLGVGRLGDRARLEILGRRSGSGQDRVREQKRPADQRTAKT